jgi:hypothetical protein
MTDEAARRRRLEMLGLEPGATAQEIKTAYRDMAKVWHPDRFAHDPRLQRKAQERLKEINEAYRSLLSGGASTRTRTATHDSARASDHTPPRARDAHARDGGTRRRSVLLALAPLLVFCATFAAVTPRLLRTHGATTTGDENSAAAQQPRESDADETRQPDEDAPRTRAPKQADAAKADAETGAGSSRPAAGSAAPAPTPVRALATVSVVIDPATNLLARADCPHKLSVTYPAGEEPRAYCDAEHARAVAGDAAAARKQADKSRLKSLAGRVASPSKWFGNKGAAGEPAKESPPRDQSPKQD